MGDYYYAPETDDLEKARFYWSAATKKGHPEALSKMVIILGHGICHGVFHTRSSARLR